MLRPAAAAFSAALTVIVLLAGCSAPVDDTPEKALDALIGWTESESVVDQVSLAAARDRDEFGSQRELLVEVDESITGAELEAFLREFQQHSERALTRLDGMRATVRAGNFSIVTHPLMMNRTLQMLRWLRDDPRVVSGEVAYTHATGTVALEDPFAFAAELHEGMAVGGGTELNATITTEDRSLGVRMSSVAEFPNAEIDRLRGFMAEHPGVGGIVSTVNGHASTKVTAPTTFDPAVLRGAVDERFERATLRWGVVEGELDSFRDENLPLVRAIAAIPGVTSFTFGMWAVTSTSEAWLALQAAEGAAGHSATAVWLQREGAARSITAPALPPGSPYLGLAAQLEQREDILEVRVVGSHLTVLLSAEADEASAQTVADAVVTAGLRDSVELEVRQDHGRRDGRPVVVAKDGTVTPTVDDSLGAAFVASWG